MNKKLKLAIPFAVLALSCGIAAAGCDEAHTHDYSAWGHDDTQHWKECPKDHVKDESTIADHIFVAGECECGATETVEELKYGNASGQVKIHKQGAYLTDYSDVTVSIDDDDVECAIDKTTGKFTITGAVVGKNYTLTISKPGYFDYSLNNISLEEGDDNVIGGTRGAVLEYKAFTSGSHTGSDWNGMYGYPENIDFSHTNDEKPYFRVNSGTNDFYQYTVEQYDDVAVSAVFKATNAQHNPTIGIVFEENKAVMARIEKQNDGAKYKVQWIGGTNWEESAIKEGTWDFGDGEEYYNPISSELKTKYESEGLELQLVRKGKEVSVLVDGIYLDKQVLPDEYADKKCRVNFALAGVNGGEEIPYEITTTLPAMTATTNISVEQPQGVTGCAVTADKTSYAYGENIELTIKKVEGYKLRTITVAGKDRFNDVKNGKLTVKADRATVEIVATFTAEKPVRLNMTVKGKKLGAVANLAKDTVVTFKGTDYSFTVGENGAITAPLVVEGRYTVSVAGYIEKDIEFDENLKEITLEYDLMENLTVAWGWSDKASLDGQNDGILTQTNGVTQWVSSKDGYDSVAITATVVSGGNRQGVFIRFKGDSYANDKYAMIQKEGNSKVSWNGESNLWGNGSNLCGDWTDYANPLTEDDLAAIAGGNYELTLVRDRNKIHVFVNGKYCDTKILDASYADQKCYVGVYCTDIPAGAEREFRIEDASEYLTAVTITDGTAEDAHGTIEISENVKLGDTVTVTVKPAAGYMLDTLTVSDGVTPAAGSNNTFTFFAAKTAYTVTATFKEKPANEAEAAVSGIGLNAAAVDMNGKEISFKPETGAETKLTVAEGKISGVLAAGTYTVSCEGFYDLTATVEDNGTFAADTSLAFTQKIFEHNILGDGGIGDANKVDYTHAATEGYLTVKEQTDLYAFSNTFYDDVAFTATFKKDANGANNQGIFMAFGKTVGSGQQAIGVRFENNKAQFLGDWLWGLQSIGSKWDFGEGEAHANPMKQTLLDKYASTGLTLTLARKGGMAYVLIDGEVYAAHLLGDYADKKVCFGIYVPSAKPDYNISFDIDTDVDALLSNFTADSHGVRSLLGNWTVTDTTLAVNSNGYVEFAPTTEQTKESLKVKIAAKNSNADKHAQGLTYRFDNGKWLAVRIESSNDGSYIQYSQDSLLPSGSGWLKGWNLVQNLSAEEVTAFNGDGIDLQLVRDGKDIYVLLGGNVIDKIDLGDEYATMDGVIAATVEKGTGTAYAYEYKTGDNVTVPTD